MTRISAWLLALTLASGAGMAEETPYLLGVEAYKKKNDAEAVSQWTKAAARAAAFSGHSEAQWHLGTAYETGEALARDYIGRYGRPAP